MRGGDVESDHIYRSVSVAPYRDRADAQPGGSRVRHSQNVEQQILDKAPVGHGRRRGFCLTQRADAAARRGLLTAGSFAGALQRREQAFGVVSPGVRVRRHRRHENDRSHRRDRCADHCTSGTPSHLTALLRVCPLAHKSVGAAAYDECDDPHTCDLPALRSGGQKGRAWTATGAIRSVSGLQPAMPRRSVATAFSPRPLMISGTTRAPQTISGRRPGRRKTPDRSLTPQVPARRLPRRRPVRSAWTEV